MHQEIRVAGLLLRRREGREFRQYSNRLPYDPEDYEVLLRQWSSEPFKSYLDAFSSPAIQGEAPEETLLKENRKWTAKLAGQWPATLQLVSTINTQSKVSVFQPHIP